MVLFINLYSYGYVYSEPYYAYSGIEEYAESKNKKGPIPHGTYRITGRQQVTDETAEGYGDWIIRLIPIGNTAGRISNYPRDTFEGNYLIHEEGPPRYTQGCIGILDDALDERIDHLCSVLGIDYYHTEVPIYLFVEYPGVDYEAGEAYSAPPHPGESHLGHKTY